MSSRPLRIVNVRAETPTQCTLVLDWQVDVCPGQFAMVWIPGVDEVPMGFSRTRPTAAVTVQRMGEATEALCSLRRGDVVGVRGPLGRGFDLVEDRRCLVVGGGNGAAPLVPLVEELVARDCVVDVVVGARTRDELLFLDRFEAITGASPHTATDDGTEGHHGSASTLTDQLMDGPGPDVVYTCGPELMMAKVAASCWDRGVPLQASLERYMKCGIGLCDSCAFGPFLVCRDGPVFDGDLLRTVEDFGEHRRGPSGEREPFVTTNG